MQSVWQQALGHAEAGDVDSFMKLVSSTLNSMVREQSRRDLVLLDKNEEFLRVREIAHLDPYTRRGFSKPRGYAGDAVLLDYVYGSAPVSEDTDEFGLGILKWCQRESAAFAAVRARKHILAREMIRTSKINKSPRILSVGCGHLREYALAAGALAGGTSLVALDQDPYSLAVVRATYGDEVTSVEKNIADLIANGAEELGNFDLITSAGLYDYLDDESARALTTHLAMQLNREGRLLVANFVDCWERGYMECIMKWRLRYRSVEEVAGFSKDLKHGYSCRTYLDDMKNICFLEVDKRAA